MATTIFNILLALFKAVPAALTLYKKVTNLFTDYQIKELRQHYNLKENKQLALQKAIMEAKDDQTRIALSIVLSDINKL